MPRISICLRHTLIVATLALVVGVALPVSAAPGVAAQPVSTVDLVGTWEGESVGETGRFVFLADGQADIFQEGKSLRASLPAGAKLRYETNTGKAPMEMDLVAISPDGIELGRLKMIFAVLEARRIKLRTFFNDVRPAAFDDEAKDDTVVLTKLE